MGGNAMLFQKKIDPRCAYCRRGAALADGTVMCPRKGVVSAAGSCRAFRYEPMKRTPPKPALPDFSKLKDEDFTL